MILCESRFYLQSLTTNSSCVGCVSPPPFIMLSRGMFGTTNRRGGTGSYRRSPILTGSTLRQGPSTRRWKHSRVMSSIRHAHLSRTVGCGNAKAPTPGSPRRVRQLSGRRSRQKVAHITRMSAVAAALFFRPRTHTICAESGTALPICLVGPKLGGHEAGFF